MANIGTGELSNSIATIIAAQVLGYLKANTVMARLVARDWDNEVATHGQVIKIPYGGSLSVNDKAADTVVTLQTPSDAAYTVTLNKQLAFLKPATGPGVPPPSRNGQPARLDIESMTPEEIRKNSGRLWGQKN